MRALLLKRDRQLLGVAVFGRAEPEGLAEEADFLAEGGVLFDEPALRGILLLAECVDRRAKVGLDVLGRRVREVRGRRGRARVGRRQA